MIPFSPPRIDQKILAEVCAVLRSGWITTGPKTKLFEKKLAEYCGNKITLALNSATAGLELMLRWFGVQKGDEVIVPAYTYCASANVVIHCGAKPVFVDVNADDFTISVSETEKAITPKTKVIIPVDYGGFPCQYDEINILAKHNKKFQPRTKEQKTLGRILVLADAAHSLGATYKNKHTGSLTDSSVFSFHAVKNLTTAEGGAIALHLPAPFNNADVYQHLRVLSLHGQTKDALAKTQKDGWRYDVIEAGYKCNMTDLAATMGLVELGRYEHDTLVKRKHIFETYSKKLSRYQWAQLPVYEQKPRNKKRESSYHLYPLRIKGITERQRDAIVRKIFARGVAVNVHFIPLPMLSFYKSLGYDIKDYPVAYDNFSREISLPVYYDLTDANLETVVNAVIESVQSVVPTGIF